MSLNLGKILLLVLGSHRSGTSVVAKTLEVFGLNLGESLLGGNSESNPMGHFENLEVLKMDEEILNNLRTSWIDPKPLEDIWLLGEHTDSIRVGIRKLVDKLVFIDGISLLKEPRISLLIDLWGPELVRSDIDLRTVVVIRHPNEVAYSLLSRDRLNPIIGLHIWAQATINSIKFARKTKNCFVFYQELLESPIRQLDLVASILGLDFVKETNIFLSEQIKSELRHHQVNDEEESGLRVATEMYHYIRRFRNATDQDFPDVLLVEWQANLDKSMNAINMRSIRKFDNYFQQRDQLTQQRDQLTQQRDQLTQQRDQLTQQRDQLNQNLYAVLNSKTWRSFGWYRKVKKMFSKRQNNLDASLDATELDVGE